MAESAAWDRVEAEIRALRAELAELRNEQHQLAQSVAELAETFRSLAMHLGIASEPYRKDRKNPESREIPGFG